MESQSQKSGESGTATYSWLCPGFVGIVGYRVLLVRAGRNLRGGCNSCNSRGLRRCRKRREAKSGLPTTLLVGVLRFPKFAQESIHNTLPVSSDFRARVGQTGSPPFIDDFLSVLFTPVQGPFIAFYGPKRCPAAKTLFVRSGLNGPYSKRAHSITARLLFSAADVI
jgi:hypothetical protein